MFYAGSAEMRNEEIVGRWLAVKRDNTGLSLEAAACRLEIDAHKLELIEKGSLDQLTFIFEKMINLYEVSEFELIALQRDLH